MSSFLDSYDDAPETTERHERRITRCTHCRARIVYLKTAWGRPIAIDADSVEPNDEHFDSARHVSHFAMCPNMPQSRR